MYCFVILLLFNEMQMSVRRFSAIPHLRATDSMCPVFNLTPDLIEVLHNLFFSDQGSKGISLAKIWNGHLGSFR